MSAFRYILGQLRVGQWEQRKRCSNKLKEQGMPDVTPNWAGIARLTGHELCYFSLKIVFAHTAEVPATGPHESAHVSDESAHVLR